MFGLKDISPRRVAWLFYITLLLLIWAGPTQGAQNVPRHDLQCSAAFPCPKALQRRVDFWVEVFKNWGKNSAILHDNESPWRVYKVVGGVNACSEQKVKREKKRLRANLNALADRLKKDQALRGQVQKSLAEQFDHLNSTVAYQAAKNIRCQLGVKEQFSNALIRFIQYRPLLAKIIAEAGMPEELVYLPFVESSYRPDAYSKVGAAGMWQIMPKTARALGMELNAVFDDRLDPEAATRGAMQYFKNAHKKIVPLAREAEPNITQAQINPFIVTSYNYGINGMRRAIKQIGPDFPKVLREYKSAAFQVAVKNFYASFLAASHLARLAQPQSSAQPLASSLGYQTFVLPAATSMQRIQHQFGLDDKKLKPLNPALTRFAWNNWRLIPAGYRLHLPYRADRWLTQIDALNALRPEPLALGRQVYRVRRGDTACGIANAFKVKCKDLIAINRLGRKAMVRIGQKLDVPEQGPVRPAVVQTIVGIELGKTGLYRVRKGDTACQLAAKFGVPCREFIRLNQLGRRAKIIVGQKLRVPGATSSAQTKAKTASLTYKVKKGDTACEVAQRYAVSCTRLIEDNHLGRKAQLRVGQPLLITGRSSKASNNVSLSRYTVRRGDTACEIAERFDITCSSLIRTNRLGHKAKLHPGQVLDITSVIGPVAISDASDSMRLNWLVRIDNLPDMSLKMRSGKVVATVLSNETLAHYSDWMGGRGPHAISRLNGIKKAAQLQLGQQLKLPMSSPKIREQFTARRSEFHQVLAEQFKERFTISEVKPVTLESGQNLWELARQYQTPLWLLMRFNPNLKAKVKPGQVIDVPLVKAI